MYGLYGLKHHTVEMLPCGTDGRRTREDKATQPLDAGRLSFAKSIREKVSEFTYLADTYILGA